MYAHAICTAGNYFWRDGPAYDIFADTGTRYPGIFIYIIACSCGRITYPEGYLESFTPRGGCSSKVAVDIQCYTAHGTHAYGVTESFFVFATAHWCFRVVIREAVVTGKFNGPFATQYPIFTTHQFFRYADRVSSGKGARSEEHT